MYQKTQTSKLYQKLKNAYLTRKFGECREKDREFQEEVLDFLPQFSPAIFSIGRKKASPKNYRRCLRTIILNIKQEKDKKFISSLSYPF